MDNNCVIFIIKNLYLAKILDSFGLGFQIFKTFVLWLTNSFDFTVLKLQDWFWTAKYDSPLMSAVNGFRNASLHTLWSTSIACFSFRFDAVFLYISSDVVRIAVRFFVLASA